MARVWRSLPGKSASEWAHGKEVASFSFILPVQQYTVWFIGSWPPASPSASPVQLFLISDHWFWKCAQPLASPPPPLFCLEKGHHYPCWHFPFGSGPRSLWLPSIPVAPSLSDAGFGSFRWRTRPSNCRRNFSASPLADQMLLRFPAGARLSGPWGLISIRPLFLVAASADLLLTLL